MTNRRDFLKRAALGAGAMAWATAASETQAAENGGTPRPNILWITCEDTSPWFGFCGEAYARTPNLDRFAAEGVHFTHAYVTAPVCSPCRFAVITGLYAQSMGTQRLRSQFAVPDAISGFPAGLRRAGYYCTNNVKTDYNTSAEKRIIAESWDACSAKAHWRGRKPGQPFFAIFNLTETHQGQIFEKTPEKLEPGERHDPAKAPVPPYYPDTAGARRTMARVHDCITAMDRRAGSILAELDEDGLREDTIVCFWPDHGQGIPRGKRTLWDTGLKVPLVIRFPEKYRPLAPAAPGAKCDRLLSIFDLGPTMLRLAGLPVPGPMQGRAFLGPDAAPARTYVYGARDRVDEAMELSRSVRDSRYLYIRNYMPDLSWNAPEYYSDQLQFRRELARLAAEGKLNETQSTYAGPAKPPEALYDTEKDPWQVKNLAGDPASRPVLERMRKALRAGLVEIRDLGFMHEGHAAKLCADGRPLSEVARDAKVYDLERVLDTANRVGLAGEATEFVRRLADPDATIRYWAAIGLRVAGTDAAGARDALHRALGDGSPSVQVEAAGVLVAQGDGRAALEKLAGFLRTGDEHALLHAARTLQMLGAKARPAAAAMREALARPIDVNARESLKRALADLET